MTTSELVVGRWYWVEGAQSRTYCGRCLCVSQFRAGFEFVDGDRFTYEPSQIIGPAADVDIPRKLSERLAAIDWHSVLVYSLLIAMIVFNLLDGVR